MRTLTKYLVGVILSCAVVGHVAATDTSRALDVQDKRKAADKALRECDAGALRKYIADGTVRNINYENVLGALDLKFMVPFVGKEAVGKTGPQYATEKDKIVKCVVELLEHGGSIKSISDKMLKVRVQAAQQESAARVAAYKELIKSIGCGC